jgi:ABC-type multidrug transport system fused ATPase/permease subunit
MERPFAPRADWPASPRRELAGARSARLAPAATNTSAPADTPPLPDALATFAPVPSFVWLILHFPLAVLMYKSPILATAHQAGAVLWAFYVALNARRPEKVVFAMAYIIGAEVLWRSTDAKLPYESAKYVVSALSLIGVVRFTGLRFQWPPVLYFLLLLPSIAITVSEPLMVQAEAKTHFKVLVFNLAGPLALACCVAFLSHLRLKSAQLLNIFIGLLAPTAGAAGLALFAIRTAKNLHFGRTSVSVIREEFGPNQLSAAVGLGVLMVLMVLVLHDRATLRQRIFLFAGLIVMIAASMLTFSRGGMYNTAGASVALAAVLLRDARVRLRVGLIFSILFAFGYFVALPYLNTYTNGTLLRRFSNTSTTGRDKIAWDDLQIWVENPVYGVGPGRGTDYRFEMGRHNQAHTEFTRLLAEHGSLGFVALILLLSMAWRSVRFTEGPRSRAITAALILWTFIYMANAAMRLAAPAFVFSLATAWLSCDEKSLSLPATESRLARKKRVKGRPVTADRSQTS